MFSELQSVKAAQTTAITQNDRYTLATGELGAYRLSILNIIHRPYTESLFRRVRLEQGMVIADIGCGTGTVSNWLAQQVGSSGSVVGVDLSVEQVEQARRNAKALGLSNVTFSLGSAYDTGLPQNFFDLVYCRFLLMHLTRPIDALVQMRLLLKPGGLLVCEEADFSTAFCEPSNPAYNRCFELFLALSHARGQHLNMGIILHRFFQDSGFVAPEISLAQAVVVRGETKRVVDLSLFEANDVLIEAGLTTLEEINQTIAQIKALAADETTAFGIPRVTQVWARK
ncbi:type 11 methyltransferase [Nostoc commune NIES-4072]|uniref:Type 11 methyltransferase n=1 Tax=Nostoc commune NIES-4072 TaxID=2005467 RepID=A0A2R5FX44_NOSCO|nr:class I SAM-dependent methyltransferase [Nostoc commune]BBD70635.1 type 11 methyltransferase [Nostoc commune HK-02]GBG23290.1 type 11 methyltransferase [Nostoc commune NIES-4072]